MRRWVLRTTLWVAAIALTGSSLTLGWTPRDPVRTESRDSKANGTPQALRSPLETQPGQPVHLAIFALSDPLTRGPVDDVSILWWGDQEFQGEEVEIIEFIDSIYGPPPPVFYVNNYPPTRPLEMAPGLVAFAAPRDWIEQIADTQRMLQAIASRELTEPMDGVSDLKTRDVHERLNRTVTLHLTETPRPRP